MICAVKEGCENQAGGSCSVPLLCGDGGCGKKVCDDHRSKHCQLQNRRHGKIYVCQDCEPTVLKKMKI